MPGLFCYYEGMILKVGQTAPEFTLQDQGGIERSLKEYRGVWAFLYFYPKDATPGCTKEACAIRDDFPDFGAQKARVLGVSTDSVASHKKFAEKYSLPFTLLSDEKKEVVGRYGVSSRTSFLINPEGVIAKIYENVKPEVHAKEVLQDLRQA